MAKLGPNAVNLAIAEMIGQLLTFTTHPNEYHGIQILHFLPVAACRPNMGVSGWCLGMSEGVWGCLDGV